MNGWKVIAAANQKGGAAKSTHNLGRGPGGKGKAGPHGGLSLIASVGLEPPAVDLTVTSAPKKNRVPSGKASSKPAGGRCRAAPGSEDVIEYDTIADKLTAEKQERIGK